MVEYNIGSKIIAHLEQVDKVVAGEIGDIITCEINSSNCCQNDCEWCIYKDYLYSKRCHLDLNVFKKVLVELKDVHNCKSITFTGGGEPLVNPKIREMIDFAKELGFEIGLITNGVSLDLVFDKIHLFKFIRVSLDATSREEYIKYKKADYFYRVCNNIKNATSRFSIDFGISMLYLPGNEESANRFSELGESLGCTYSQIKPLVDFDVEKNNVELRKIKGSFQTERHVSEGMLPCQIAGLIGQVSADGCCYYCCIHAGRDKYRMGNLYTDTFAEILERRKSFIPDFSDCSVCRYMNYAIEYLKVKDKKYRLLRHIQFL